MSNTYQSPAEAAAEIRGKLKKLYGITSRQVSVRCASFSMGSSLDVTINDPAVDIREVRNIADCKEKIDRCELTGEILSGSNRYLEVKYGDKAVEAFAAANREACAALLANLPGRGDSTWGPEVQLDGKTLAVCRQSCNGWLVIRDVNDQCKMPAGLPDEQYLDGERGIKAVASAVLSLRSGRA